MSDNAATSTNGSGTDTKAKEKDKKSDNTPVQDAVLALEKSLSFDPEQTQILYNIVVALDPSAAHGGYTKDGQHLWAKDADKAHRVEIGPDGNATTYNG